MSNFDEAFVLIEAAEKGYVKDPKDPGGETKYGISKRQYPKLDIAALTLEQAKGIYLADYWNPHKCGGMPWHQAILVFDCAVNGGPVERYLSLYAGYDPPAFIEAFQAERALYYASLSGWVTYGRGWMRRLIRMAHAARRDLTNV